MLDVTKETDIEILRHACGAYDKANRQLLDKVRELTQALADAQGLGAAQIGIDLPDVCFAPSAVTSPEPETNEGEPAPAKRRPPQRGHGPTPQMDLPTEVNRCQFDGLPDCTACGQTMGLWEGQFEESEEITVVEASYKISLIQRQKYRCRCNSNVLTAPGPPKLIAGGRYSVDFACHSAVAKFCDHLPLERQVRQMARRGLTVTSQTLWDQQAALAKHLEPTWQALCAAALATPVLNVDETGWRMMGSKTNTKWTLFGLTSPTLAVYHLMGSKSAATAHQILKGFHGILVVDGYAVYPLVAELEKTIRIAHCWAHADRKFKEAKDPPRAIAEIRGLIFKLYKVERKVAGPFPGDDDACAERRTLREQESRKLIDEIRDWAFAQGGLRRSSFGKAVRYMLKHWDGLTLFLEDPSVALDNNAAERVLRGPVVGRKNFYGNRSKRGAKVAAILYSLIETAKLNGIDPAKYLEDAAHEAIRKPGAVLLPT